MFRTAISQIQFPILYVVRFRIFALHVLYVPFRIIAIGLVKIQQTFSISV